jgi:hypothetical protein
MARKDLTALAALGTLGYMLSKKGDKKDSAAAERRIAADKEASEIPEKLDVARNLDDDMYSDYGSSAGRSSSETVSPPSKPTAPKPITRKPVVKSRPMSEAAEAAMQEANVGSPMTRAEYDMGISNVPRRNSYYKKGGKVKKMASGGMASSASKRADGIATKGKTKCKMY